jgi:hypothetical protein
MQVNMSSELILKEVSAGFFGSYRTFALKRKTKQLFLTLQAVWRMALSR